MTAQPFRSGFAALVGRPNVGKSTLLNQLVGQKVAIVSDKPQTTRNRIAGVMTRPGLQAIFLDTPGIHKPHHRLGEHMVTTAVRTLDEVDAILFVVDVTAPPGPGDQAVAGLLHQRGGGTPVILVANKIDQVHPDQLLVALDQYSRLGQFHAVVPVSAATGKNAGRLVQVLAELLPEGPQYYPDDAVTDQPEQFLIAEVVREQVLHRTREEVPHAVAVRVDEMAARPDGTTYVRAVIHVERDSQKGILIGRGGRMLKEIGRAARAELEPLLGAKLFLDLWVKVLKDWRDRDNLLQRLGFGQED